MAILDEQPHGTEVGVILSRVDDDRGSRAPLPPFGIESTARAPALGGVMQWRAQGGKVVTRDGEMTVTLTASGAASEKRKLESRRERAPHRLCACRSGD